MDTTTDLIPTGTRARFDYGWPESTNYPELSARDGRNVTVLGETDHDGFGSRADRDDAGQYVVYAIRFDDGHEDIAFEYELTTDEDAEIEAAVERDAETVRRAIAAGWTGAGQALELHEAGEEWIAPDVLSVPGALEIDAAEARVFLARQNVDRIHDEYRPRFDAFLQSVGDALEPGCGLQAGDVYDLSDSEYRYDLVIENEDGEDVAAVALTLLEELVTEGGGDGIAFGVSLDGEGGEIIGQLTPYNYSEELWVSPDDADAIEERWSIIESSADEIAGYLIRWAAGATS